MMNSFVRLYLSNEIIFILILLAFVSVRYDATENRLITDLSQQRRILKRRYYLLLYLLFPFGLLPLLSSYNSTPLCISTRHFGSRIMWFTWWIMICRYYLVEKAKDANIVGILVGTLGVGMFTSESFYYLFAAFFM